METWFLIALIYLDINEEVTAYVQKSSWYYLG